MSAPAPPSSPWDSVASSYHTHASPFTSLPILDLLRSLPSLPHASTILDLACGPGPMLIAYLRLFPRGCSNHTLILMDLSAKMVEVAKQTAKQLFPENFPTRIRFLVGDGQTLEDVADQSVDVVVSAFGVFMFPDVKLTLANIRRVLTPGGVFANAAWTDLPENTGALLRLHGFGAEFQPTVERVFAEAMGSDATSEQENAETGHGDGEPLWKRWADRDGVQRLLKEGGFEQVSVYRSVHTTTFADVDSFWKLVSETCPFGDLDRVDEEGRRRVRESVVREFGVKEGETLYMVLCANLSVARKPGL